MGNAAEPALLTKVDGCPDVGLLVISAVKSQHALLADGYVSGQYYK